MKETKFSNSEFERIPSLFEATFKNNLFLFNYRGLPRHLHFTFSFNGGYWNIHLTKENGTTDNKPRITIAKIKSDEVEEVLQLFLVHLRSQLLCPLKDQNIGRAYRGAGFISADEFQQTPKGQAFIKQLEETISDILLFHRRKMKVPISAGRQLLVLANPENFIDRSHRIKLHRKSYISPTTKMGLIINGEFGEIVVQKNKKWYVLNSTDSKKDIFATFLEPGLRRQLILDTLRAISRVQAANTYADTAQYDQEAVELRIIRSNDDTVNT